MKVKRIRKAGIITIVIAGLMAGCGQKHVDLDMEDTQSAEASIGLEAMKEQKEFWSDSLTTINEEGENVSIQIGTYYFFPEVAQMGVMEVKEPELDSEYKKRFAQAFFEGDIYSFEQSKGAIQKELEIWESKKDAWGWNYLEEERLISLDIYKEYQKLCELGQKADQDYVLEESYEGDSFYGTYQGKDYKLTIAQKEDDLTNHIYYVKYIEIALLDDCMKVPEEMAGRVLGAENVAEEESDDVLAFQAAMKDAEGISQEDAQKAAAGFLQAAGFSDWILEETGKTAWEYYETEMADGKYVVGYLPSGYRLKYTMDLEGMLLDDVENQNFLGLAGQISGGKIKTDDNGAITDFVWYTPSGDEVNFPELIYDEEVYIEIFVNEEGTVTLMRVNSPVEVVQITKEVELLSLDRLQKSMKQQLKEKFTQFYLEEKNSYSFSKMSLGYYRYKDMEQEGYYSYIPVWELSDSRNKNYIYFNAMDGHMIDTAENYSLEIAK